MADPVDGEIFGYCNKIDVLPGDDVAVMVSADAPEVTVDLVRLRANADTSAVTYEFEPVTEVAQQVVPAKVQECYPGSYGIISDLPLDAEQITLTARIWPTMTESDRPQTIAALHTEGQGLHIALDGTTIEVIRTSNGNQHSASIADAVHSRYWYEIQVVATEHVVRAIVRPQNSPVPDDTSSSVHLEMINAPAWRGTATLTVGARLDDDGHATDFFNGKIESPLLRRETKGQRDIVGHWDFSRDHSTAQMTDISGYSRHGRLINAPMRAVTGSQWTGDELDFSKAGSAYGAIHFHEDDLDDAGWEPTASVRLPDALPSGVYAIRLRSAAGDDHVPIFVSPPPEMDRPRVAFLASTYTYLAYANARLSETTDYEGIGLTDRDVIIERRESQVHAHHEFGGSLYDKHTDGSGVCYTSHLRPILTMRCDWRSAIQDAPRHLAADLLFPAWLDYLGHEYDVINDHGLHERGYDELAPYSVVITSSHPEYWSSQMLDALARFQANGGSIMYLGANGFYWVTNALPDRPHVLEIRRGHSGIRTWESEPGELYLSATGEPGGLWRHRGRAPNRLVGIGMAAQGWDTQTPGFVRGRDGDHPDAAFIFEGIDDEVLGDFGLILGGASGDEIDRADFDLGTPRHALIVATSQPHSKYYLAANEEIRTPTPVIGGDRNPNVRSDIVYYETPAGGAVFSVGAISFVGSLAYDNFSNNIAQMCTNVLRNFADRRPPAELAL